MSNPINSITDPDKWESGINSNYELNGILFDITENIEINNKQFLVRGENGSIATGKLYVLNNDTNGITAETYLQGKSYTDELRSVSLTVDSATDLNGTLDVQNATTLRSTLNVLGDANLDGTLDVSGTANLQNAVTMNSTLDINGDTNINGQTVISSNTDSTLVVKATSNISQDTMLDIIGARNSNNTAYQSQLRLMNYDNDITTTNILGAVVGKVNNTATNIGDMILQTSSDGTTMSDTMTLTSSGNVGIGTDNPNHKLSICDGAISRNTSGHSNDVLEINVQSDEAFILLESRQTLKDSGIRLYTQGVDSAMYYNESDDHFAISIGNVDGETNRHNNEKFVIDSTGNVGIGTTDPAQKLTVYKNTRFNPTSNVSYDGDYTLNIQSSNNNYNNGNYGGSIVFSQRWWTGDSALVPTGFITTKKETNSGNFGGGLILGSVSGTTHNEVIHIKTNGNVGIGTDNPSEKLDVNGNAKISGDLAVNTNTLFVDSVNNRVGINTITPEYGLDVNTLSRFTQNIEFTGNNRGILGSSGSNLLVYSQGNGTGEGLFLFNSTDDGTDKDAEIQLLRENVITFSTNNDERMRIAADGDVGIGTLNPAGKLDVGGNIIISGTITNEPENLTIRYYDNNNYINPGANSTLGSINFDANWGGTYQTHNQIKSITSSSQSNGRVRTSLAFLVSNTTSNSVANLYEAMRIEDDGNVGIGTAAPTQKLDVNGNAEIGPTDNESMVIGNMGYSGWSGIANKNFASAGNYALLQNGTSGQTYLNTPSGQDIVFRENNATRMTIKTGGNLGIGTDNPTNGKLEIVGSDGSVSLNAYNYNKIDSDKVKLGKTNVTNSYSIYADGKIAASEFNAISDKRIKTNIINQDIKKDIDFINNVNIYKYNFIDKITNGSNEKIGFIAQEIEELNSNIINYSKKYIPNIYKHYNLLSDNKFSLDDDNIKLDINDNLKIQIFNINSNKYLFIETKIIEIDQNIYTFDNKNINIDISKGIFIYGKLIDDFLTIDTNQILAINTNMIKFLYNKIIDNDINYKNDINNILKRLEKIERNN